MATIWMDLARYADTHGYTVDRFRDMSPWRDWVIKAYNENMPYDEFVTVQLAGDLFDNPTKDQILATGFNRNHQQNMEGGIIDEEFRVEYVADRTNTFGTAFLGLTLECARCHDHRYDPISQKEYYELFSFFNNVKEAGQISWNDAIPGPSMLLIVGRSMRYGAQRTHASILGNITALLFSCSVMAAGFSALFATSELLVGILRMLGAAYPSRGARRTAQHGTVFVQSCLETPT